MGNDISTNMLGAMPALSGFLDLLQLADHPGDRLAYRHFQMTPLCAAKYPDGIPSAAAISIEFSTAFATKGLARTFRELRALFPKDPTVAWSPFVEGCFNGMLRMASEFEMTREPGTLLSVFLDLCRRNVAAEI